jgi:predicted esterase
LRAIFASPYTPQDWRPMYFASDRSPPTLLLHGLDDKAVYSSHAEKLRDALLSHGANVETHFHTGRGQAGTAASFTLIARFRTPALEQTLAFLERVTITREHRD